MGYIYQISNNVDDRVYIGSTINLNKRWNEHRNNLLKSNHQNIHLQRFVNKYGMKVLKFSILEEVNDDELLLREQYYLNNIIKKFNIATNAAAPMLGKSHDDNAKKKISIRSAGKNNPMYGKKRPQWIVNKLVEHSTGRKKTIHEKIIRIINLPNRIELIIEKNGEIVPCFSISHAAKIIGVTQQSVAKAMKSNKLSKGWGIKKSDVIFYDKNILMKNLNYFDECCHPQPELIQMLKSLK